MSIPGHITPTEVYTTTTRDNWGSGPWDGEPDKVVWVDQATGLDAMARRGPMGAWCGYVGLPDSHPLHGVDYDECPAGCGKSYCEHSAVIVMEVHGGVTFAGRCQVGADPATGLCHVSDRPVWWLGFDCAHWGDLVPGAALSGISFGDSGIYADLPYVVSEVESLARQIGGTA